jgi:DNA-binding NtrC family response regulator
MAPSRNQAFFKAAAPARVLIGDSPVMRELREDLHRLAQSPAKVLITGESGVGKELVANFLHVHGPRVSGPFVAVNCAGIPESLLETELFGHTKGSFTGAYRDKPGKFEVARGGTLFLDEVGEMTLRMQGLLLRVLETGELQKVGADHLTIRADCRVIAATNQNLHDLVQRGLFRQDLYYRLNVIQIHIPPLRERQEDIPLLADYLLKQIAAESAVVRRFASEVHELFRAYSWPGNVRQLENVVQRLVFTSSHETITSADVPAEIRAEAAILPVAPRVERRKSVADVLHRRLQAGEPFWDVVHRPYMEHEITRADLRQIVHRGLEASRGSYRVMTKLFGIEPADYRRFLNFLRSQDSLLPFRDYR